MQAENSSCVKAHDAYGYKAAEMLMELLAGSGTMTRTGAWARSGQTETGGREADIEFCLEPSLPAKTGLYRLKISSGRVLLEYGDSEGARNAAIAVYRILSVKTTGRGNALADAGDHEFEDSPDYPYRGVMIDPARVYIPMEDIFATIRQAAIAGMNKLNMHLCDSGRYAIESVKVSELNAQNLRRYSIDEMKQIIGYADLFGLEVVPHFDVPAHASHILECFPELRCEIEDGAVYSSWAVCAAKEATYAFLDKALEELAEIFPSKYVFLCGDELEFADLPEYNLVLNWPHCAHCRELSRTNGYRSNTDLFYHFVRRAHAILTKYDKKMMLANDNIDISRTPEIPRDILIVYWRIAMEGRGPVAGCSMERFLEEGFEIINMDYPEAYIDLYMTEEKLRDWSPVSRPYCPPEYRDQVLGSMICAWEGKKHYEWTLPSGIIMFGDRIWNSSVRPYDKNYYIEVLQRLLGPATPPELDVFSLLGACLLPLDEDSSRMGFPDRVGAGALPAIAKAVSLMESIIADGICEKELAAAYLRCLNWMADQISGGAK